MCNEHVAQKIVHAQYIFAVPENTEDLVIPMDGTKKMKCNLSQFSNFIVLESIRFQGNDIKYIVYILKFGQNSRR